MKLVIRLNCLSLLLTLSLSGCSNDNAGSESIEQYVQKAKRQYAKQKATVPDLKEVPTIDYIAKGLRNPFERPRAKAAKQYPNAILQRYALTSLALVGTLTDPNSTKVWAFISTPDGKIYKITKGARVGARYALVTQIDHNRVEFREEQESGAETEEQRFTLMLEKK